MEIKAGMVSIRSEIINNMQWHIARQGGHPCDVHFPADIHNVAPATFMMTRQASSVECSQTVKIIDDAAGCAQDV